jgi:hypothetical protein
MFGFDFKILILHLITFNPKVSKIHNKLQQNLNVLNFNLVVISHVLCDIIT